MRPNMAGCLRHESLHSVPRVRGRRFSGSELVSASGLVAPDPAHPSAARGAHAGARAQPLADNFPLGGAATHCLVRCFHQCQQDHQCELMCDKVRAGCDFMCKRIRSGHVHTLPALFMADEAAADSRAPHPPKLEL